MGYFVRTLEPVLGQAAREFPVVVLTGPRQSGKTTLLKHLFGKSHEYVSLEVPDVRASAVEDPRSFLELHRSPVIFDEVQYAPSLLPYIKERVDAHRDQAGRYILTVSQDLLLVENVTETLAGRSAILRLLPLSRREVSGAPQAALPWEGGRRKADHAFSFRNLWKSFLRGGYPELAARPGRDAALWQASYVQTYLERDVRSLRQIGDLTQFQSFIRALAARSAQLLNVTDLARDLGVAVNTVRSWLSILEATYQVFVLRPYFRNVGKRLVKTPKVYFSDVGILCYLVGLREPDHAMSGSMAGAIMKTAVIGEVIRSLTHRGVDPHVYYWRTSAGAEVDLVVEAGDKLVPIEVKLSATPGRGMARGIESFKKDYGRRVGKGYVVHPGDTKLPLGPDVIALPFSEL